MNQLVNVTPQRRRPTGRKSLLEREPRIGAEIIKMLATGTYIVDAAEAVGVHRTSVLEWIAKGDAALAEYGDVASVPKSTRIYADFAYQSARVRAQARNIAIGQIRKAGQEGDWKANAWYLERTAPDLYGQRNTVNLGITDTPETDEAAISAAQSEAERHRLAGIYGMVPANSRQARTLDSVEAESPSDALDGEER